MNLAPFFLIVLPILTILSVGLLGRTRRLGFWPAVVLSILITPLGGLIAAVISGPRRIDARPKALTKAPRAGQ